MHSLAFLAALGTVSARVFDRVARVPEGWRLASPALASDKLTLKIGLKQQHALALEQTVLAISTPGHADYGKHLSREALRSYVAPAARATGAVAAWLAAHAVVPAVDNDWMTITTTVATANALLDASFGWYAYEDAGAGGPKLRTLSYSVPDAVAHHVDLVQPTTRFGRLGAARSHIFNQTTMGDWQDAVTRWQASASASASTDGCGAEVQPQCLKSQYKIGYTPRADGNLVAFASYLEQYARYDDLTTFQQRWLPGALGQNFSVGLINGGENDQESSADSLEANLDVQYVQAISAPIPIREYSTGGRGPLIPTNDNRPPSTNEPYLEFLTSLLNATDADLPQTLTTSYGEEEQSVPADYALKVCNLFMQLGARGVSVLFSSGDAGPGATCKSNVDNATTFLPIFPAGCPWVTAVGATTGSAPEQGLDFSGGGFSTLHARPAYQAAAVTGYLAAIGDAYAPFFARGGRAYPDVAAQGLAFAVVDRGRRVHVGGTSAAAPVVAGAVALLNAARRAQRRPPLGFLNPFLYRHAAAFTDVTAGASRGCDAAGSAFPHPPARWNCTAGWDPVTGLGSPRFDLLLEVAAPGTPNK